MGAQINIFELVNTTLKNLERPGFVSVRRFALARLFHKSRMRFTSGRAFQMIVSPNREVAFREPDDWLQKEMIEIPWKHLVASAQVKIDMLRDCSASRIIKKIQYARRRALVSMARLIGYLYLVAVAPELPDPLQKAMLAGDRTARLVSADWLEDHGLPSSGVFRNWLATDPQDFGLCCLQGQFMKEHAHEDIASRKVWLYLECVCCMAPLPESMKQLAGSS